MEVVPRTPDSSELTRVNQYTARQPPALTAAGEQPRQQEALPGGQDRG